MTEEAAAVSREHEAQMTAVGLEEAEARRWREACRPVRFVVWVLDRCLGGWSPSMGAIGVSPTLRWVRTGKEQDLRRVAGGLR